MDGGTGDDVVELVSEGDFPGLVEVFCRIGREIAGLYSSLAGQPLSLPQLQLGFPVIFLIAGLGGVGASVVLQIKFAVPGGHMAVGCCNGLLEILKVIVSGSRGYAGKTRHCFQMTAHLQHVTVDSAASVSVSVSQKQILVDLFVMVEIPLALDRYGIDDAVIGVAAVVGDGRCAHEMSQHLGAVHADPAEGIVRHMVVLVPADLDRHEIVDAGTLQDLGQGPAVAEHIRKPEYVGGRAEFFLEETLAVQDLTHQSLTGGNVTVGLNPHGAVGLPVAGFHSLLNPLVDVRIVGLDVIVKLGLGLDKSKFRVLLHQGTHRREGAGSLFSGVLQLPEPGHVDMGMAHSMNGHRAGVGNFGNLLVPDSQSFFQGFIKSLGTWLSPVDGEMRPVDGGQKLSSHGIIFIQNPHSLNGRPAAVVKIICSLVQNRDLCLFELVRLRCGHAAALQTCPETNGKLHFGSGKLSREDHFLMIGTGLAVGGAVDIDQAFKAGVQSVAGFSHIKKAGNLLSCPFCRDFHGLTNPHISASSGPEITFFQSSGVNDALRTFSHRLLLRCTCVKCRNLNPLSVAEIFQLLRASFQFFQCKKHACILLFCRSDGLL